jgi:hypothetical protein
MAGLCVFRTNRTAHQAEAIVTVGPQKRLFGLFLLTKFQHFSNTLLTTYCEAHSATRSCWQVAARGTRSSDQLWGPPSLLLIG